MGGCVRAEKNVSTPTPSKGDHEMTPEQLAHQIAESLLELPTPEVRMAFWADYTKSYFAGLQRDFPDLTAEDYVESYHMLGTAVANELNRLIGGRGNVRSKMN
jgi:hypothetical protein